MTTAEIRQKYLDFFKARGHKVIARARIVPENDPTTLFTGSGMQPLLPYLLGEKHPDGNRLADSQTCFRAEDIDEVGNTRHTTFFEMLGNWSLGDYFKKEQLPWFFEFLTDVVGLDPNKLYVTCYSGDEKLGIPKDTEAAEIWKNLFKAKGIEAREADMNTEQEGYKIGMKPGERIFYYRDKNWWSRVGEPANMPAGEPGGPDSEVFFDVGTKHNKDFGEQCHPNCDCGRWIEVGNSVFMQYVKNSKGGFDELPQKNVDFGGGLERIASASIGGADMFKIDLLWPIIEKLEQMSGKTYSENPGPMRVIADHMRSAVFMAADGVTPSNKTQGYILRRLLRRAIRQALELDIKTGLFEAITQTVINMYKEAFPEIAKDAKNVQLVLEKEEKLFRQTLQKGLREFEKLKEEVISGKQIFTLFDTYGFPPELTEEEAKKQGKRIKPNWEAEYQKELEAQRERSRSATKGVFKGGLADQSETVVKYHTTTHIMYKALRLVLGDHVEQRGSNITDERTRFDFNHPAKMTDEEIKKVEEIVNDVIKKDLPVTWKEMPTAEALKSGARGHFGEKYGDTVKVYTIGPESDPYTMELCGGPHVEHTGVIGEDGKKFKIIKEQSSSAGIRRIKAVLQ